MNCLGKLSRDSGHMRVPDPPHMITGMILVFIDFSVCTLPPTMNVLLPGDQMVAPGRQMLPNGVPFQGVDATGDIGLWETNTPHAEP